MSNGTSPRCCIWSGLDDASAAAVFCRVTAEFCRVSCQSPFERCDNTDRFPLMRQGSRTDAVCKTANTALLLHGGKHRKITATKSLHHPFRPTLVTGPAHHSQIVLSSAPRGPPPQNWDASASAINFTLLSSLCARHRSCPPPYTPAAAG